MVPSPPSSTAAASPHPVANHASDAASLPLPPPSKRVRRDYPWRAEYEREFGVRPIQVDAATGDAVLVECRFCVSFGREPPVAPVVPPVNKAGQPIKSRARTRNIAHWKYPFRTDNMRSHHLQQHAQKWAEYTALLEQTKQQLQDQPHALAQAGGTIDENAGAMNALYKLNAFFGESADSGFAPTTPVAPTTTPTPSIAVVHSKAVPPSSTSPTTSALLPLITNTEIVDMVLPELADVPTTTLDASSSTGSTAASLLVPVKTTNSGIDGDAVITQFTIASDSAPNLQGVVPLLAAGLSFHQVAKVAPVVEPSTTSALTRDHVAAYARALVASGLERIAQLIAAAWTYSVRLTASVPVSDRAPTLLRVSVCVPVDESRKVETYHVAMLALHQTADSVESVASFLRVVLSALDRNWQQKMISVRVEGATHCLGMHAERIQDVVGSALSEPVVSISDGCQDVEEAVQTAWASFFHGSDEQSAFAETLLELVARVRASGDSLSSHCPLVQVYNARSVLRVLKWLLGRRDVLGESGIMAPLWWWLLAHVIVDVWTDCLVSTSEKLAAVSVLGRGEHRAVIEQLIKSLTAKCGVTTVKPKDTNEKARPTSDQESTVEFDESTRVATVRVNSTGGKLAWNSKDIAHCLRALNVSTRRMIGELSKDAVYMRVVETQVSRLVLLVISQLQQTLADSHEASLPVTTHPTLPLDFEAISASDAIDLVETHARRLEVTFPTLFLDRASRETRDLQTLLTTNQQLRDELSKLATRTATTDVQTQFATSWALVPQFATLRTLAAGLCTALPTGPMNVSDDAVIAYTRAENDETPRYVVADLAVEAVAHARQLSRLEELTTAAQSLVV